MDTIGEVAWVLTPEPERPRDPETTHQDGASEPRVHNTVSGPVGGVVQAGVVHGDVHLRHHRLHPRR